VRTIAEFATELDRVGIGNTVDLTVRRQNRSITVTVNVMDMS
jgi:hypothetical protein